ncbi:hypothetical protein E2C01_005085 [Portunus trituberculatus]|uniref:Uncharacterized protein n=1 Tax=Portunus trituberculatus TaxID=210409 RepID=A0A5B7CT23_PORTR|nr:hypothetical protein [Portunus trituberculatus]
MSRRFVDTGFEPTSRRLLGGCHAWGVTGRITGPRAYLTASRRGDAPVTSCRAHTEGCTKLNKIASRSFSTACPSSAFPPPHPIPPCPPATRHPTPPPPAHGTSLDPDLTGESPLVCPAPYTPPPTLLPEHLPSGSTIQEFSDHRRLVLLHAAAPRATPRPNYFKNYLSRPDITLPSFASPSTLYARTYTAIHQPLRYTLSQDQFSPRQYSLIIHAGHNDSPRRS